MKAVIMAGGRGTRISSIYSDIPKPMIPMDGMPVLEREIRSLSEQGLSDLILTVGHLGQMIVDHFGNGSKFGVRIEYYVETEPLGTGGALFRLKEQLTEDFLLLNGDVVFDVDFGRFIAFHRAHGGLATLFTHPNSHPYDSSLIIAAEDGTVLSWITKEANRPQYYKNRVNAGLHILSPHLLDWMPETPKIDLDRQILRPLAGTGSMYCYDSPEYVRDMGTPERYLAVSKDIKSGLANVRNLRKKQAAIFLDRDGTLNKYVGFLRDINDFELLPDVAAALRKINESGYLAIVVTNQPVIARGELTLDQLTQIHNKLETSLGKEGAWVDAIYFCPHHPDGGFDGEIPALKVNCSCRKPKPGMLINAANYFNIDLHKSWMIGDSENDMLAGKAAGCHTIMVKKNNSQLLLDAINRIIEGNENDG